MKAQGLIARFPKLQRSEALRHPQVAQLASELAEEPPELLLSVYVGLSVQLESYVGCEAWPSAFQAVMRSSSLLEDLEKEAQELQTWQALLSGQVELGAERLKAARALVRGMPFGGLMNDKPCNVVLVEGELRALQDLQVNTASGGKPRSTSDISPRFFEILCGND